jgi:cyclin-A
VCALSCGKTVQLLMRPLTSYTSDIQSRITSQMRYVLVDWLVEVAEDFRLSTETLFLCVGYVDRFLSRRHIQREELQLLGITCLLIASKYEEINPPHIERFAYVSDNACTVDDIVVAEGEVLSHLGFKLATPTAKVCFLTLPKQRTLLYLE